MPKQYRIEKLEDFFSIPRERIEVCLREFSQAFLHAYDERLRQMEDGSIPVAFSMNWIDDGESTVTMRVKKVIKNA